jgi:hypothetical protein
MSPTNTLLRYYPVSKPKFEVKEIQKHISCTTQETYSPLHRRLFRASLWSYQHIRQGTGSSKIYWCSPTFTWKCFGNSLLLSRGMYLPQKLLNQYLRCGCIGKVIPLQALTGPDGSRSLLIQDFKTFGTWSWQGCQPYAPVAFTPRKYSWYSCLLEAESTPGS